MSPHSHFLSISSPLSSSLPLSLSISPLGDSSVHAASNLSHCLSGCSVYALCATLLFSPLCATALHCTARIYSHLHLSSFSFPLFSLPLPASLSLYTLLSFLCIAVLCSIVWENNIHSGFFAPELSTLSLLVEEDSDAPGAPGLAFLGLFGSV